MDKNQRHKEIQMIGKGFDKTFNRNIFKARATNMVAHWYSWLKLRDVWMGYQ